MSSAHERCLDDLMRNFSAELLADGEAKPWAKLSKQISGNHRRTRLTRPTRPTSLSAKREAQRPLGGAASPLPDSTPHGQRGRCPSCEAKSCAKLTGRRFAALEPSGAAGWAVKVLHGTPGMAKRHSVRMSRHEVWPEGQTRASESPLTGRIDERAMKGRDLKTPSRPSPCGAPRARVVPEP